MGCSFVQIEGPSQRVALSLSTPRAGDELEGVIRFP
jgi:hypothetical protein